MGADDNPWGQRLGFWWIAQDHPELVAIRAAPSSPPLTFGELAGRAHQLVHGLRAAGIKPGDIVSLALPNGLDLVVWQLAAQEGGFRYLTLNPALSPNETREIVRHAGSSTLVVHVAYLDRFGDLGGSPVARKISVGGRTDRFVEQSVIVADQPRTPPTNRRLGGGISYSSGTTAKPKSVWRRFPNIDPWEYADRAKTFGHAFRFRPLEGVHLVSAGMHHSGCQGFYLGALNVGQGLVIMEAFDAETALRLIEEHRVSTAYMVPTQFVRFLRLPAERSRHYDLSSLESVVHSAAPCPVEIKRQMLEWWGPVIWETYGGMEGAATIAKPHRWLEKPGTVGRAVRGMTVRILDDDGVELGPGEVGHVYLDSGQPSFEYKDDPELTRAVHRGTAFTLGDLGYLDEDGYLFICDRAKDLIISGGVNIYPAEVEAALSGHPLVADVAVIGVPDSEWGEQVKALVEVVPSARGDEDLGAELRAWCRERLAGYKCPRSVEFRRLPRTDGGKLAKRHLRDEYWAASDRAI